jgi:hypothetical protein
MTAETRAPADLTERLARAAVAAIADIAPQLEAAWPQLRLNMNRALGVGRG